MSFKFLFVFLAICLQSSIYNVHLTSIDGSDIDFSGFKGKKLLVVNIASGSSRISQLNGLEQLQQKFKSSLVVIAVPSNSFGHESKTGSELKQLCAGVYHASFLLGSTVSVSGSNQHPLFSWLSHQQENGRIQGEVTGDFQKYLIDEQGNLVGVFSPGVAPMDNKVQSAISASYN